MATHITMISFPQSHTRAKCGIKMHPHRQLLWNSGVQYQPHVSSRHVASAGCSNQIVVGWPEEEYPDSKESIYNRSDDTKTDVLGLGQAMVDFGASVENSWLEKHGVAKGSRSLISVQERTSILEGIDEYHIAAGGSLSNTLIDLARLARANSTGPEAEFKVAMAGLVGSDALGSYYRSQMKSAGVSVIAPQEENVHTGTVIVLTTDDAQRTMLSYLGTQKEVEISKELEQAISNTSILVIEGYLWELPNASKTILQAIRVAKEHGVQIAMTAGDAGVVDRNSEAMWESIHAGVDILFTNADEAASLARNRPISNDGSIIKESISPVTSKAEAAALCLAPFCPMVCVTDGSVGSVIASLGQMWVIPPHWTQSPPVDTCGAGDAWAAGMLFGLLSGGDIVSMGHVASRSASAVIAKHGPTLCPEAAASVMPQKSRTNVVSSSGLKAMKNDQIYVTDSETLGDFSA
ncbi:sugar kinase [Picochlorum sp. SENEW3]|nr:sugar kinase [Picochlorum sp. SENEW3]